jgi:hypothetical protein
MAAVTGADGIAGGGVGNGGVLRLGVGAGGLLPSWLQAATVTRAAAARDSRIGFMGVLLQEVPIMGKRAAEATTAETM